MQMNKRLGSHVLLKGKGVYSQLIYSPEKDQYGPILETSFGVLRKGILEDSCSGVILC